MLAARACVRQRIPFVVSPDGTAPPTERRIWLKRILRVLTGDRSLERATRVLAVSHAGRTALVDMGVGEKAIAVVPNPVDLPSTIALRTNGFLRCRLPHVRGPIVLFLAKVTPRKNLPIVMSAIASVRRRDVHLVVAGSDHGGLRHAFASSAARALDGRMHLIGVLEGEERFAALADADVVACPSTDEAFGLVACEALACGT